MRILVVANHYPICSGRYLVEALDDFGHDVRHAGKAMGRDIWGLTLPPEYEWKPDYSEPAIEYATAPDGTFDPHWEPDLTIVMDSDPDVLQHTSLQSIRRMNGTPAVVYGVDNHVRRYDIADFDRYFLAHKAASIQPYGDNCEWLPCGYDSAMFGLSQIPWSSRKYDVVCLGVMYPNRLQVVRELQQAGLNVLWGVGLVGEAYRDAYQNSRISLCLSAAGDVAQRVFETAAMGCLVVTEASKDLEALNSWGIWTIEPGSVTEQVKSILSEPDKAQAMIKHSHGWALGHTWEVRASRILEWYEETHSKNDEAFKRLVMLESQEGDE